MKRISCVIIILYFFESLAFKVFGKENSTNSVYKTVKSLTIDPECKSNEFLDEENNCIDCSNSPCGKCNGTNVCLKCPKEYIIGPLCNQCKDLKEFYKNKDCYDCLNSPCENEDACDGSDECQCKDGNCCQENGGYYYNNATKRCVKCSVKGCGSCGDSYGKTCEICLKSYLKLSDTECLPCKKACGNHSACDGGEKCIKCRTGLTGDRCELCDENKFLKTYFTDRLCLFCEDSPCKECNGTAYCVSCPPEVTGDFCEQCIDETKYLIDRECIDCTESPCGAGNCDGTKECDCPESFCCGVNDGFNFDTETFKCADCSIANCGKCDSIIEFDCSLCIDGSSPQGDLATSCKHISNYGNQIDFELLNFFLATALLFLVL